MHICNKEGGCEFCTEAISREVVNICTDAIRREVVNFAQKQ